MGCCASQPAATSTADAPKTTTTPKPETSTPTPKPTSEAPRKTPPPTQQPKPAMSDESPAPAPEPAPAATSSPPPAAPAGPESTATATGGSYVAPAPGVKHVRAAYAGKGWAPPQKEYTTSEKKVGDKTRIEIQDEWDDDGNLRRTTVKHIITPDWKKKTEKTIEIIPADEAEKMGLGRKK